MMRAALILTSALTLGACNIGSAHDGPKVTRAFPVGAFDHVALAGSHDVVVAVGAAPSVRAEGDSEAIDRLDIRVENGVLKIGTKSDQGFSWSFGAHHHHVTLYVTAPSLAGASIGGSGDMKIDKVSGSGFEASIGGSGDMDIGSIQVSEASLSVSGSGDLKAAGKAGKANIRVSGSGNVTAGGFESGTATISVVGSGDVAARVMQSADVSVTGSGDVTLSGTAKCNISKVGSGEVRCGG